MYSESLGHFLHFMIFLFNCSSLTLLLAINCNFFDINNILTDPVKTIRDHFRFRLEIGKISNAVSIQEAWFVAITTTGYFFSIQVLFMLDFHIH